ncbi:MAG TPA: hypothetical protein VNO50_00645 [Pyrinomonadaceae bacterium]|nr:hypothetical protein [Pyrinomonadaceae bacterium]
MEDPKQERAEAQKTTDELLDERQSDATSDETLAEVEENRTNLNSNQDNGSGAISPDGALDESEEIKEAGPM